jgi:hypothetical protein
LYKDDCSNFNSTLSARCPQILADRNKWLSTANVTVSSETGLFNDQCSAFDSNFSGKCLGVSADWETWDAPTVTDSSDTTAGPSYILIILGSVLQIALLVGFIVLVKMRRKSAGLVKTSGASSNAGARALPSVLREPAGPEAKFAEVAAPYVCDPDAASVIVANGN